MVIAPHPDRAKFSERLAALGRSLDVPFNNELFRFINPQYSKAADIISGAGALHASGRWNLAGGAPLSYTAWGFALTDAGFEGAIVPSAADPRGANALIFPANLLAGSQFAVVSEVKWA